MEVHDPFSDPKMEAKEESKTFRSLLLSSGLNVESNEQTGTYLHCANCSKFSISLRARIEHDSTGREAFIQGLEECFEEPDASELEDSDRMTFLNAALLPIPLQPQEHQQDEAEPHQALSTRIRESLIQLLLRLDCIQNKVIELILDKFATVSLSQVAMGDEALKGNIARLLLHQLRWLDFVVDPKFLADKLLECVETVCGFDAGEENKKFLVLQQEIISIIPEIIAEQQHPAAVTKLQHMLQIKAELTVAVIEALSNLKIPANHINAITTSVLNILRSSPLSDVPVAIKFLLESSQGNTLESTIVPLGNQEDEAQAVGLDDDTDMGSVTTTSSANAALNVIHEMRDRLLTIPSASSNPTATDTEMDQWTNSQQEQATTNDRLTTAGSKALILRVLVNGLLIRNTMAKAYLQSVSVAKATVVSPAEFHADLLNSSSPQPRSPTTPLRSLGEIDWWTLVSLYGSPRFSKPVFSLIKKHVLETRLLDWKYIECTIKGHGETLESLFTGMLNLASSLLRYGRDESTSEIRKVGAFLFINLFREFSDPYLRQQVVHALIMHCGGGSDAVLEVDAALSCLMTLAKRNDDLVSLHPFAEFVKHLTDRFEQFSNEQTRIVFFVITRLVLSKVRNGRAPSSTGDATQVSVNSGNTANQTVTSFQEEDGLSSADTNWLHLLIRKYSSSPDINRRIVGVISTAQYVAALSPPSVLQVNGQVNQHHKTKKRNLKRAKVVFESTFKAARSNPQAMAFLLDEFAYLIQRSLLNTELVEHVSELVCQELTTQFTRDIYQEDGMAAGSSAVQTMDQESEGKVPVHLPLCFGAEIQSELWMNLDDDCARIGINILYLLSKGESNPKVRDMLLFLGPTVRLLMATGSCDEYDALLGAPLLMPQLCIISDSSKYRQQPTHIQEAICMSLFHACNWVRELLNSFSLSDKADVRAKVVQRLENLVQLEEYLVRCVRITPSFVSQLEQMGLVESGKGQSIMRKAKVAKKARKVEGDEQPLTEDDEQMDEDASGCDENENAMNVKKGKRKKKKKQPVQARNSEKTVQTVLKALRELRNTVCNTLRFKPVLTKVVNELEETISDSHEEIAMSATELKVIMGVLDTKVRAIASPKKKASPFASLSKASGDAAQNNRFLQPRLESQELESGCGGIEDNSPVHSPLSISQPSEDGIDQSSLSPGGQWLVYCTTELLPHVRTKVDSLVLECVQNSNSQNPMADGEMDDATECIRLLCSLTSAIVTSPNLRGSMRGRGVIRDALRMFKPDDTDATQLNTGIPDDEQLIPQQLGESCLYAFNYSITLSKCAILTELGNLTPVLGLLDEIQNLFEAVVLPRISKDENYDLGSLGVSLSNSPDVTMPKRVTLRQYFGLIMSLRTKQLLKTDWETNHHQGSCYSRDNLSALINAFLRTHQTLSRLTPFKPIEKLSSELDSLYQNKFVGGKYPCLNKTTFDNVYRTLLSAIIETTTKLELKRYYRSRRKNITWARGVTPERVGEALGNLLAAVNELERLVLITRQYEKRIVLNSALQQGNAFVSLFKSVIMPFLDAAFRDHRDIVLDILQTFQKTTRQLQSLCAYGKNKRDSQMMRATPAMKRALETVIFQVKQLCSTHDCEDIFRSGVLKSRNIDGSRHVASSESSAEDEE